MKRILAIVLFVLVTWTPPAPPGAFLDFFGWMR
jgi:hypothetical protein